LDNEDEWVIWQDESYSVSGRMERHLMKTPWG
jgi:hypothetical protein